MTINDNSKICKNGKMNLVETVLEVVEESKPKIEIIKDTENKCKYAGTCNGYDYRDYICNQGKGRFHGIDLTTRCYKLK